MLKSVYERWTFFMFVFDSGFQIMVQKVFNRLGENFQVFFYSNITVSCRNKKVCDHLSASFLVYYYFPKELIHFRISNVCYLISDPKTFFFGYSSSKFNSFKGRYRSRKKTFFQHFCNDFCTLGISQSLFQSFFQNICPGLTNGRLLFLKNV